ncbi:hypothetical protein IVB18_14970 [Bradyrhizobium sp. 186]|uniref:hypothetical protein n=1 Tax=Bradyrhizobium sp. 186 TaxID=2782654 RepID=UPI002001528A|nr:hypothetical protein [Bradyrhizobium sp. 186]UPK38419.1 hypothetical protein IVB18_14970 [Bradyrhizobium sp. 186]
MSDSGIGMLLGHLSANLLWLWFIGAFLLGAVLAYGVAKAGRLRRSERARLDRDTEALQRQEDPYKRPS